MAAEGETGTDPACGHRNQPLCGSWLRTRLGICCRHRILGAREGCSGASTAPLPHKPQAMTGVCPGGHPTETPPLAATRPPEHPLSPRCPHGVTPSFRLPLGNAGTAGVPWTAHGTFPPGSTHQRGSLRAGFPCRDVVGPLPSSLPPMLSSSSSSSVPLAPAAKKH